MEKYCLIQFLWLKKKKRKSSNSWSCGKEWKANEVLLVYRLESLVPLLALRLAGSKVSE